MILIGRKYFIFILIEIIVILAQINIIHTLFINNNDNITLNNQNNFFSNNETQDILYYTHGEYSAVCAMKFEFNINKNYSRFVDKGLVSDLLTQKYTHICVTYYYSLAAHENGDIIFFGYFGNKVGDINYRSRPRIIWRTDQETGKVEQLECGIEHSLIRTDKNLLFGFGENSNGQLGFSKNFNQLATFTPVKEFIENVKFISSSAFHTLYIDLNDEVWISGKYSDNEPIFQPIKLIINNSTMKAIHISALEFGGVLVGVNNCLYYYGSVFGNEEIEMLNNLKCNLKKVFVNSITKQFVYLNTNDSLIYIDFENNKKTILISKENRVITGYSAFRDFIGIQFSDNSVLGFSYVDLYNLKISNNFEYIELPESNGINGNVSSIKCSLEHCLILGPNSGIYTAGIIDFKTCNQKDSKVVYCNQTNYFNSKEQINFVIPFTSQKCRMAIIKINNNTNIVNIVNCLDYSIEFDTVIKNFYFPREYNARSTVFSNIFGNIIGITAVGWDLSLNISKLNLTEMSTTNEEYYIENLSNFFDFQYVSIIENLDNKLGFFHLSRGKYSKLLAIVELDDFFNFKNTIKLYKNIEYFIIDSNKDIVNFIGIQDTCKIVSIYNYLDLTLEPENTCIKLIKIAKSNYHIIVLSDQGQVFMVSIYLDSLSYSLDLIEIYPNQSIVHISATENYIYFLDSDGDIYYMDDLEIFYQVKNIRKITKMQPFSLLNSDGIQLYTNIKCNGFAADDFRVCNGHGRCMLHNTCICISNYFGPNCQEHHEFTCNGYNPIFINQTCSGNGDCIKQDTCLCYKGYSGKNCFCYGIVLSSNCIDITLLLLFILNILIFIIPIVVIATLFEFVIFIILCFFQFRKYINIKNIEKEAEERLNDLQEKQRKKLYEIEDYVEKRRKLYEIDINLLNIKKLIGKGGEAEVYEGEWEGEKVAIKRYTKAIEITNQKQFTYEIDLAASIHHPNIVSFIGAITKPLGFVMELTNTSVDVLFKNFEKYPEKETLTNILKHTCRAMVHLHSKNVVHRDLKWQNVLMSENGKYKISDFGLSRILSNTTKTESSEGTYLYMAPEIAQNKISSKVDVFAFGFMIYELLSKKFPWPNGLNQNLKNQVKWEDENLYKINIETNIKNNLIKDPFFRPETKYLIENGFEDYISICEKCWSFDPNNRPTFNEILEDLQLISIQNKNSLEFNNNKFVINMKSKQWKDDYIELDTFEEK